MFNFVVAIFEGDFSVVFRKEDELSYDFEEFIYLIQDRAGV